MSKNKNRQIDSDLLAVYGEDYARMPEDKKEKLRNQYRHNKSAREIFQKQAQQNINDQNASIATSIQAPTLSSPGIIIPERKFGSGTPTVEFGDLETTKFEEYRPKIVTTRKFKNKRAEEFVKELEKRGIDWTTDEGQQLWESYNKYMSLPGSVLSGANINDFFNSNYVQGYYDRRQSEISQQAIDKRNQAIYDYAAQHGIDVNTPEGLQQATQEWQSDTYAKSKQGQYDKQVENLNNLDAAITGTLLGGIAIGTGGIPALAAMGAGYGGNYLTDKTIAATTDYNSWNDMIRSTGLFDHVQDSPAGRFYSDLTIDATNPGGILAATTAGSLTSTLQNNWIDGINPVQFARRFGQDIRAGVFNETHGPVLIEADASRNAINGQKGAYSRWYKIRLGEPEAMPEGYDNSLHFISESKIPRRVGNDRLVFDNTSMFDGHLVENGIQGEYRPILGEITNNAANKPVARSYPTGQFQKAPMLRYASVYADPWNFQLRPGIWHFNNQQQLEPQSEVIPPTPPVVPIPDNRVEEIETYIDPWEDWYSKQKEGTTQYWAGDINSTRSAGPYIIERTVNPGHVVATRRRVGVGENDSRGQIGTVVNDSTITVPSLSFSPNLGRTIQFIPGAVNPSDTNIGPDIIPINKKGNKLVPKAFLGIRFGKSNVEKKYEAERDKTLRETYGDLMNDKKTRKWAEKDYDKKWNNSKSINNFQYNETSAFDNLDDRLNNIRTSIDQNVNNFYNKFNFKPKEQFTPTQDVEDAVDWNQIAKDAISELNTPVQRVGDYRSDDAWEKQARDLGFNNRQEVRDYQDWANLTVDVAAGNMLKTQGKSLQDYRNSLKPANSSERPNDYGHLASLKYAQNNPSSSTTQSTLRIQGKDLMGAFDNLEGTWTFRNGYGYKPTTLPNGVMIKDDGNSLLHHRQYSIDNGVTWKDYNDYVERRNRSGNSTLNTWYD